jgi:prephenate dehydrogenase
VNKIAIVGLGQIGGSLALSLRKRKVKAHLTGFDLSSKRIRLLKDQLDSASTHWKNLENHDLIFICLHFEQTMEFLRRAPINGLLVDVCSGKEKIIQEANRLKLRMIGGHPLAGNEREAEKGWDADLFDGRPFFLCRTDGSSEADLNLLTKLIRRLGAYPVEVDPKLHDRYMAMTSHFPAFLSQLFAGIASGVPSIYGGPGYQSMTRLARTPSKLLQTFLESNGGNIRSCAEKMQEALKLWIQAHHRELK